MRGVCRLNIRRLLRRCLEKDPKKRLRDIGDVGLLLEEEGRPDPPAVNRNRTWYRRA